MITPILGITRVTKAYGALRPLRIEQLQVNPGEQLAILGLDQPASEMFVNLSTGAALPDSGDITIVGRSTASVTDSTEWLSLADTFGIVSERAVLLDAFTAMQNLAIPFSLDVETLTVEVQAQAYALAKELRLPDVDWERQLREADPVSRLRVRLGRALALGPQMLLLEHPSIALARADVPRMGRELRAIIAKRRTAAVTLTADAEFASAVADRVLSLDPASGRLTEANASGWFGRWRRSQ